MYQDDFCVRICELLSRRFLQKSQIFSILHIPQTIPLFQSNYILSSMDFFYVPAMGQYTRAERGGQGRKPKLREERRNERHKSSENAQKK